MLCSKWKGDNFTSISARGKVVVDEACFTAFKNITDQLENGEKTQDNMDYCYDWFCNVLDREISIYRPKIKVSKQNEAKPKIKKPYWNNELQNLWKNLCLAEKRFLKCKDQITRRELHNTFKDSQYDFDKRFRFYKRQYRRGKVLLLEYLQGSSSNNNSQFWREINKLGPKRQKAIPSEILTEGGESLFQIDQVLNRWETD